MIKTTRRTVAPDFLKHTFDEIGFLYYIPVNDNYHLEKDEFLVASYPFSFHLNPSLLRIN